MVSKIHYFTFPGLNLSREESKSLSVSYKGRPTKQEMMMVIAQVRGITVEEMSSKVKTSEIVNARVTYIRLLKDVYKYNKSEIARLMGKDHTTIIHNLKNFDNRYKYEDDFRLTTDIILEKLNVELCEH